MASAGIFGIDATTSDTASGYLCKQQPLVLVGRLLGRLVVFKAVRSMGTGIWKCLTSVNSGL